MYYSPVRHFTTPKSLSCDLHVLSAPPAFVLSQDQTLNKLYFLFLSDKGRHFNTLLDLPSKSAMKFSKNKLTTKFPKIRLFLFVVKVETSQTAGVFRKTEFFLEIFFLS